MAYFSLDNIKVSGIASCVPAHVEDNADYPHMSAVEKKAFLKTVGIERRHVAKPGTATSDLCFASAKALMDKLDWNPEDVGILIFLSQSPDYYLPATSIILQDRLELPKSCMAFDIGLGCSGYVYGLSVIQGMMKSAGIKKGLLLVGDVSSATCHVEDKSTYPIFGDAGTATALELDTHAGTTSFSLHNDGSGHKAIHIPDGGLRNLASKESFDKKKIAPGISRTRFNVHLEGIDVYNFSVREVPPAIKHFLELKKSSAKDYDFLLMHQANRLINETIRKRCGFSSEQTPYTLKEFGNTSSASIPLTICHHAKSWDNSARLLLAGFGVGLSWGIADLNLQDALILDPILHD